MFQHSQEIHPNGLAGKVCLLVGAVVAFVEAIKEKGQDNSGPRQPLPAEPAGLSPRMMVELRMKNFEQLCYL